MLSESMNTALNDQINAELYSAYLYMSMNAYFRSINLDGFATWMHAQAVEETEHAQKFFDFVNQRGGRVVFGAIDAPPAEWASPLAVFEDTLRHEQKISASINNLMDVALTEKDHATQIFLQWFVTEQVEEEQSVGGVLEQLKLMGDAQGGLFMLDRELGKRGGASEGEEA
jgi:ferritin